MGVREKNPEQRGAGEAQKISRGTKTEATRLAVMRAAMDTIEEVGYYRASSNEIARRAGFTWGVIQHHFGTREGLLLAVLEQTIDDFLGLMRGAQVRGETLEERVGSMCDAMFSVYKESSYIATLQILLDLSRDPAYGQTTRDAVAGYVKAFSRDSVRLARAVRPDAKVPPRIADFVTQVVWGLAVGQNVTQLLVPGEPVRAADTRRQLVEAVSAIYRGLPAREKTVSRGRGAAAAGARARAPRPARDPRS